MHFSTGNPEETQEIKALEALGLEFQVFIFCLGEVLSTMPFSEESFFSHAAAVSALHFAWREVYSREGCQGLYKCFGCHAWSLNATVTNDYHDIVVIRWFAWLSGWLAWLLIGGYRTVRGGYRMVSITLDGYHGYCWV